MYKEGYWGASVTVSIIKKIIKYISYVNQQYLEAGSKELIPETFSFTVMNEVAKLIIPRSGRLGLLYLANKNIGYTAKSEFKIIMLFLIYFS